MGGDEDAGGPTQGIGAAIRGQQSSAAASGPRTESDAMNVGETTSTTTTTTPRPAHFYAGRASDPEQHVRAAPVLDGEDGNAHQRSEARTSIASAKIKKKIRQVESTQR